MNKTDFLEMLKQYEKEMKKEAYEKGYKAGYAEGIKSVPPQTQEITINYSADNLDDEENKAVCAALAKIRRSREWEKKQQESALLSEKMLELYKAGDSIKEISKEYSMSRQQVSNRILSTDDPFLYGDYPKGTFVAFEEHDTLRLTYGCVKGLHGLKRLMVAAIRYADGERNDRYAYIKPSEILYTITREKWDAFLHALQEPTTNAFCEGMSVEFEMPDGIIRTGTVVASTNPSRIRIEVVTDTDKEYYQLDPTDTPVMVIP